MTEQFEQDVRRAIQIFIADIRKAALHAALEGARSAFIRVSTQLGDAVAAAGDDKQPFSKPTRRRASTSIDPAASARVVTFICEHPGWSTAQLAESLGLHADKLRRHLRTLADNGVIRIEEVSLGGLRRRTYLAMEHINGAAAEPSGLPAEATA